MVFLAENHEPDHSDSYKKCQKWWSCKNVVQRSQQWKQSNANAWEESVWLRKWTNVSKDRKYSMGIVVVFIQYIFIYNVLHSIAIRLW